MEKREEEDEVLLSGLDGGSALGFLAAIGATVIASDAYPDIQIGWQKTEHGWRPRIRGAGSDKQQFAKIVFSVLQKSPMDVFRIENKMPFDADKLAEELRRFQARSSWPERRDVDLLVGMGSEIYPDEKNGVFRDTKFRMIRSGDNQGNGLPAYAVANRKALNLDRVRHTLFEQWDYQDHGHSLRLDPIEDQRHALRWSAPNNPSPHENRGTMTAANDLAVEALRMFPTLPIAGRIQTTGFQSLGRRRWGLVWPIWTQMVWVETLRALLASQAINIRLPIDHVYLSSIGIEEVYCSLCVQQTQHYQNFGPAQPL